jgi:NSS family neurotransmitter:Na+ symporter
MSQSSVMSELRLRNLRAFRVWFFLVRYLAPAAIVVVFLRAVGLI